MADDAGAAGTGWQETFLGGSRTAERELFAAAIPKVERIQAIVAAKQRAPVRRAFHNRGVAVRVAFEVSPDLPSGFQVGFLTPGARYEGFGRFSRSQSFRKGDRDRDQRGFAFRLLTELGPQDILLSNTPHSFATDPLMFLTVTTTFAESALPIVPFRLALALGARRALHAILDLLRSPDRTVAFTGQRFWSRTAFAFGPIAARMFVRPIDAGRKVRPTDNADFLSLDLARELRAGPRSFELCAQAFVDERRTPIEDASHDWRESDAPPVVLGRVVVPQQDIEDEAGRALSARVDATETFNPWTTPCLRPLGSMNRARLEAYNRSAAGRGAPQIQPTITGG